MRRAQELVLRETIRRQLAIHCIEEGLWDDVKTGASKLKSWITSQFASAAASWVKLIQSSVQKLPEAKSQTSEVISALNAAIKQTGEQVKYGKTIVDASNLSKQAANSLAVVQGDMSSGVHDKAAAHQETTKESRVVASYKVLVEHDLAADTSTRRIDESVTGLIGIGLAVMGGLPLLFKGLAKLAHALGASNTADLMEKAEHVAHAFEQKTIDVVMPDGLAFAVYSILWKKGIKLSNDELDKNAFVTDLDKSGAMQKTKNLVYKAILIYFAVDGLMGALKAGASLLGFVEGAATSIKGVELAQGAKEIAAIAKNV